MKKFLAIILTFVLCFGVLSVALAAEDEPVAAVPDGYIGIYTAEDLDNIRNDLSGKYILMNNIDLSSHENWSPIGTSETPFSGELNGNGYVVENMIITAVQVEQLNAGLFGYIKNATVKNLTIKNCKIDVSADKGVNAGLVCAEAKGSVILNCKTYGSVDAKSGGYLCAGGVAGSISESDKKDSFVKCCANFADVNAEGCVSVSIYFNSFAVGGIAGYSSGNIYECSNHANITATETQGEEDTYFGVFAGGISGSQASNLENCYNKGNVSSTGFGFVASGGISGHRLAHYKFSYNYNVGKITAENISDSDFYEKYFGAIIGMEDALAYPEEPDEDYKRLPFIEINRCYYLNNMEHPASYPESYTEENAKKLTAEEFKNAECFTGFDFDNIWAIDEKLGRPVLQNKTKDVIPTLPSTEDVVTTTKNHTDTTTTTVQNDEPSTEEESTTQPVTELTTEPENNIDIISWISDFWESIIKYFANFFAFLGC